MSDFFENLIARHSQPVDSIRPRLHGRFESVQISPKGFPDNDDEQTIAPSFRDSDNQPDSPTLPKSKDLDSKKSSFRQSTFSSLPLGNTISVTSEFDKKKSDPVKTKNEGEWRSRTIDLKNDFQNGIISKSNSLIESDKLPEVKPVTQDDSPIKSLSISRSEKAETHLQELSAKPVITKKETSKIISLDVERPTPETMGQPTLTERFNKWMDEPVKEAARPELKSKTLPTIQVNIGRIEVKAITESPPSPQVRKTAFSPKLSLTEYLEQKNGGKR
jgi:hypothetical protein